MRLYRRQKANGEWVWWASWTEGGVTVRRSTRCSTKAAAELVGARWERERADPVYAAANEATLGSEYLVFIAECKAAAKRGLLADETVGMYRQKAGNLMRLLGKYTRLAAIDSVQIGSYVTARTSEGTSDTTIYKEWVTLRGILKSARHRNRYHRDPAALKPPRLVPNYQPRTRFLTPCEVMALLAVLEPERAAAVRFVVATGARRREVFRARHGDIGPTSVQLRGTKTAASARTIPIPPPFAPLLAGVTLPVQPWGNARRDIIAACVRAGIRPATWNDLRRTFASLLVQLGVAPHIVARLLGHTTTAMVEKVYGRQTSDTLATLMEMQLGAGKKEP